MWWLEGLGGLLRSWKNGRRGSRAVSGSPSLEEGFDAALHLGKMRLYGLDGAFDVVEKEHWGVELHSKQPLAAALDAHPEKDALDISDWPVGEVLAHERLHLRAFVLLYREHPAKA